MRGLFIPIWLCLAKIDEVEMFVKARNFLILGLDRIGREVLLTIMSSLAQEESRSISENCTWGQRKRFADGKVTVPFKRFLGYDRGEDGNLVDNPEQAKKDAVALQISGIRDWRGTMEDFLRILKQQDGEVTTFSEKLWCGLLDYATAYADGRLTFTFKNGSSFEG